MIMLSLNIRGIRGTLKLLSLCCLCESVNSDVVFLQETMVSGEKAREMFAKIKKEWEFSTIGFVGQLGGLLLSWNSRRLCLTPFLSFVGIWLEGFCKERE